MLVKLKDDYRYDLKMMCYYLMVTSDRTLDKPFVCTVSHSKFITNPNITCKDCPNFIDDSTTWRTETEDDRFGD